MGLISKILRTGIVTEPLAAGDSEVVHLVREVDAEARRLFGRALGIREVDAGSCNGCEIEITGLMSPVYDSERFGFHFVASPRHADLLLAGYASGAAAALALGTGALSRWASALGAIVGASAGLALAAGVCIRGAAFSLDAPGFFGPVGGMAFTLDPLGAVFLALTSLVAAPSALYGAGYA